MGRIFVDGEGLRERLKTVKSLVPQEVSRLAELAISPVQVVQEAQITVALGKPEFKVVLVLKTS